MKKIGLLFKLGLITALVGGGIYLMQLRSKTENTANQQLNRKKESIKGQVRGVTDSVTDQTKDLATRAQEIGQHLTNILSNYVQPADIKKQTKTSHQEETQSSNQSAEKTDPNNSSNNQSAENTDPEDFRENQSASTNEPKPIYQETLDYGLYQYCQRVVNDYESSH